MNFIDWVCYHDILLLSPAYIRAFCHIDGGLNSHDAMGLVLMGGEL